MSNDTPSIAVGNKFQLWIPEYSSHAYIDQMGRPQKGYVVTEKINVTVTEIRNDVECMWTGKKQYTGWKAESESGELFTNNWNVFPSDSMSPTYYWDARTIRNGRNVQPVDAVQAYNNMGYGGLPFVSYGIKVELEADFIKICSEHNYAAYNDRPYVTAGFVVCMKCRIRDYKERVYKLVR